MSSHFEEIVFFFLPSAEGTQISASCNVSRLFHTTLVRLSVRNSLAQQQGFQMLHIIPNIVKSPISPLAKAIRIIIQSLKSSMIELAQKLAMKGGG